MTAPNVQETEAERQARIRENLRRLRAAGAPPERIQRYVESERITPEMEAARTPLSTAEKVAGGITSAVQGATFNFGDEIIGTLNKLFPGEDRSIDEVRADQRRFEAENPKAALGLNIAGGLLPALATAGASTAGSTAPTLARVAGSAAGGGALAGYGSGEGGPLSASRLGRGVAFGALGGALGAVAPKVLGPVGLFGEEGAALTREMAEAVPAAQVAARAAGAAPATIERAGVAPWMPRGLTPAGVRPAAQQAALRAFGGTEGVQDARAAVDALEAAGMGDEALAMNAGTDRTVRAVRAAANQPNSNAGQVVNERLARQGGALGEQVPRDIAEATGFGTQYPEVIADDMQRALSAKVKEGYDAFRALPEVPLDPSDEAQRLFIERYVDPVIANRRMTGQLSDASALSGEAVDAAFKNLQRDLRGVQTAVAMGSRGTAEEGALRAMRDRVLAAIGQTDPNYAELARTYALDEDVGKVVQEALETGRGITTPGQAVVAKRGATTPGAERALRLGHVAEMQSAARGSASNADLGDLAQFRDVARSVIGTPEKRETIVALHEQPAYDALRNRLMPKMRAAAQNAAARGNSTTAKQLLDALAFQDDAMLDAFGTVAAGNPSGALRNFVTGKLVGPVDRAMRLGVGQTATEAADLLTTRGAPQIRTLLDLLEQEGLTAAARSAAVQPAAAVATRAAAGRTP